MKRRILALALVMVLALQMVGFSTKTAQASEGAQQTVDYKTMTAVEFTELLGNGINLGNTMEAYGRPELGTDKGPSEYETYWGQPITTKESIEGMKAAGFDTLRIPIAWTNAMAFETGDYTIGTAYMDRVEEIVNYALDAGMYVMINDHWDGSWWGMFGSATMETREKAMDLYTAMWTQIAERFKGYDERLIFEAANEELGDRLNDVDICPDSGSLSVDECYEMLTKITQRFIDVIRGAGEYNESRFLLIPGYDTDIKETCDERFVMPTDTIENKLLVSVHYYTPWGYCGNASLNTWGTVVDLEEQNSLFEMMEKFTEQGYGIIIGEYAVAMNEDGSVKNNITDFLSNLLDNCDLYGYVPMLWDCSNLYDRTNQTIIDQEVADLFVARSRSNQSHMTEEEIKAAAKESLAIRYEIAKENNTTSPEDESKSFAWIMFNSGDWTKEYCVGNQYKPEAKTEGIVATDAEITGPGTYTVALDFTGVNSGFANGVAFSALGISNGEMNFPEYIMKDVQIKVNGEPYTLLAKPYVTSDDKICTRMNLYNAWVSETPAEARTEDGSLEGTSAVLLDNADLETIYTLEVTFTYEAGSVEPSPEPSVEPTVAPTQTPAQISIQSATVKKVDNQIYTGRAIKPELDVKVGGKTLTKGTDYKVSYFNNKTAGIATATIQGVGTYTGTKTITFRINPQTIKEVEAKVVSKVSYSGNDKTPKVTLSYNNKTLKLGKDYTVTYKNNNSIGTATVTIQGKGNFKGTKSLTFKITPRKVTIKSLNATNSKQVTVTMKKQSGVTGYQVAYSYKEDGTFKVAGTTKNTSYTLQTSSKKNQVFVKVRAYKTVDGKRIYGKYSEVKRISK